MNQDLRALPLVRGAAEGRALVLDEPLSLWGGADPKTGIVVDQHHPQSGAHLAGTVLVMPGGRGSSSSSAALLEMVCQRTSPVAILLATEDPILALGAIVAQELYLQTVPIVVLDEQTLRSLRTGDVLRVRLDGSVERHRG